MNRLEYLTSLRYNLEKGGLPQSDIEDALSYYEEIFLDSGYGSDEQTANSLGTPEELAREILIDSGIHVDGDAEFAVGEVIKNPKAEHAQDIEFEEVGKETDTQNANGANTGYNYNYNYNYGAPNTGAQKGSGFYDSFNSARDNFKDSMHSAYNYARDGFNNFRSSDIGSSINSTFSAPNNSSRNKTALKIIIIVLTFPIWISILATVFSLVISAIALIFSLVVGIAATAFGLLIGGAIEVFTNPPEGIMMLGAGLVITGLCIRFGRPLVRLSVDLCKKMISGVKNLWNKFTGKGTF